jgi:hypothetical protein
MSTKRDKTTIGFELFRHRSNHQVDPVQILVLILAVPFARGQGLERITHFRAAALATDIVGRVRQKEVH